MDRGHKVPREEDFLAERIDGASEVEVYDQEAVGVQVWAVGYDEEGLVEGFEVGAVVVDDLGWG